MSDPVTTARTARENLARGLTALQSDPSVPPALVDLAAYVAQAMGALHQIERSQGAEIHPHADAALGHVRTALNGLQNGNSTHPAVAAAMEAVASSLGLVHMLSRAPGAPQAAAFAATAPAMPVAPAVPMQAGAAPGGKGPPRPGSTTGGGTAPRAPQAPQPPNAPQPPQAMHAPPPQPMHAPPAQAMHAPPPQAMHVPPPPGFVPQGAPAHAGPPPFAAPAPPAHAPPPPPMAPPGPPPGMPGDMPIVEAPLGAHSPTNFYKGLSGNDIVDHGGLFVSTYRIPKIGTPLRLKVSLPGGYEFEAGAVVRWARDTEGGPDAPPGFGAQFTQITQEARQLVYRYVRNREPLFHDDL